MLGFLRWSLIAKQLPGRTDNDVKNYWNTKLKKKLINMGIDPITHKPISQIITEFEKISGLPNTRRTHNGFSQNEPFPVQMMEVSEQNHFSWGTSSSSSQFQPINHPVAAAASSSSTGNDYFLVDPYLAIGKEEDCELQGILSSNNSSVSMDVTGNQNDAGTSSCYQQISEINNNSSEDSSFVDSILARDSEILLDFPQLSGGYFDY